MKKNIILSLMLSLLLSGCSFYQEAKITNNESNKNTPKENQQQNNKLDLSQQNLEQIPEYVFGQNNLEELNVSGNKLNGAIQAEIRNLQNLKILNASNNELTGVPAEIGQLNNLEILDLSNNKLTGLPYELGNLKNLKVLNISANNYSQKDLDIIMEGLSENIDIIK